MAFKKINKTVFEHKKQVATKQLLYNIRCALGESKDISLKILPIIHPTKFHFSKTPPSIYLL